VLAVPKKGQNEDGSSKHILVIDYKILNENRSECGFHQILMKNSYIEKTAFSINNGKFEFSQMPFGLTNAPRIFQRAMDDILRKQEGETCIVYMDDIIIFSNTIEQQYADLFKIINILQSVNAEIEPIPNISKNAEFTCAHDKLILLRVTYKAS